LRRVNTQTVQVGTLAGTQGVAGFSDAPIQFNNPAGVAVGKTGAWFVGRAGNSPGRRVNFLTGEAQDVGGTGIGAFNGDNISAVSASLNMPTGVAIDAAGNIFIADTANQRIRRVDAVSGLISTVAGTGTLGFNGDNQPATLAQVSFPFGVAV